MSQGSQEETETQGEEVTASAGSEIVALSAPSRTEGKFQKFAYDSPHFGVDPRKENRVHSFPTVLLSPTMTFANSIRENIFSLCFQCLKFIGLLKVVF